MANKIDKWILEAFENAQPKVDGKTVEEFSKDMEKRFKEEFPQSMTAYTLAFGPEAAAKCTALMFAERDFFTLVKCFFGSGYAVRMKEEERKKGGEA